MEQRLAWSLASLCLLLIAIAALKPDLFEFPTEPEVMAQEKTASEPSLLQNKITAPTEVLQEAPKPALIDAGDSVKAATVEKKVAKEIVKNPADKMIEKPHPVVKKTPDKISIQTADGYYVQLGAFKEKARAQGQVDQLKHFGWNAIVYRKSNALFAVWAGPKANRSDAQSLRKAIEVKMKSRGFIVHHKKR